MPEFRVTIQINATQTRDAHVNYSRTVDADDVLAVAETVQVALDAVDQGPEPPEVPA